MNVYMIANHTHFSNGLTIGLGVLLYNGRTDNMWGACGDKIKVLPTSCQCLTHILPSPTKYLHFACGITIEAIWG